jgi:hypothetical protein
MSDAAAPATERTVYLHVGHGRCGSSSIQHFAEQHRSTLAERGLCYPSSIEMGFPSTISAGGNAQALWEMRRERKRAIEMVASYLDQVTTPRVLLSSEFLITSRPEFFADLATAIRERDWRIVAVAYVREQRDWLISRYAQAVKSRRWTMSLEEYLSGNYRSDSLDYLPLFDAMQGVFGPENLVLRVYQRSRLAGGDARADLLGVAGTEVSDLITDDPSANASGSVEEIEIIRIVNGMVGPMQFNPRKFLLRSAGLYRDHDWTPLREFHRLVPPALMKEIADYYADRNEAFRKKYFPEIDPPLFTSKIPDDYEPLEMHDIITPRSLMLLTNYFVKAPKRSKRQSPAAA